MGISASYCVHCGRVYIVDRDTGREFCVCGAEIYPITKGVVLGEELRVSGHHVRLVGYDVKPEDISNAKR